MKIEDHLPELTHPLLQLLSPNVLRPLPSMTVMQFQPVDHALSETQVLAKGTPVFSRPVARVQGTQPDPQQGAPRQAPQRTASGRHHRADQRCADE
ncbi:type VI secretion system baseplate subunit TssF [Pseudomonas sp. S37]|uniref:type VI secretion system baseplate subunit TssF n=1 Tax=Pseudomonas sp. S37 TaxID=2767449 RepID=UPI001913EE6D|nr:type VI secretion system baseplate subunit TssF [Pseudomonas sp. S37]